MPKFIALAHRKNAKEKGYANDDSPKGAGECFKLTQANEKCEESTK